MSEFNVGTKVAVSYLSYGRQLSIVEDTVDKVHKNGNFVLKYIKRQFRKDGHATGEGYDLPWCEVWTPEIDEKIKKFNKEKELSDRWYLVRKSFESFKGTPDEAMIVALEKVLGLGEFAK